MNIAGEKVRCLRFWSDVQVVWDEVKAQTRKLQHATVTCQNTSPSTSDKIAIDFLNLD